MIQELLKIYTIAELAKLLSASRQSVYRWKRGDNPTPIYKERIDSIYNAVVK